MSFCIGLINKHSYIHTFTLDRLFLKVGLSVETIRPLNAICASTITKPITETMPEDAFGISAALNDQQSGLKDGLLFLKLLNKSPQIRVMNSDAAVKSIVPSLYVIRSSQAEVSTGSQHGPIESASRSKICVLKICKKRLNRFRCLLLY